MTGEFSVFQFLLDGTHEEVRSHVEPEEAVRAAHHYCTSVGAKLGTTLRVIITDGGDSTCFEWTHEAGITFGASAHLLGKFKKGLT